MAKKKGLWIPEELLRSENLTAVEKIVLSAVISLCGKDGCFATNTYIAEMCGCDKKTVSRTLAKAEKNGMFTIAISRGNGRVVHCPMDRMSRPYGQNVPTLWTECPDPMDRMSRPYGQLVPEDENLPSIIDKTSYKTFYYSARAREEEQGGEKKGNPIPTEEDVERYCAEMGYTWDVRKFVRYNTARGWTVGGKPCADWRPLADMWTDKDDGDAAGSFDTESFFQAALRKSQEEFGGIT